MTHYTFPQAGSIPGIPGTFAGVTVAFATDGTYTITPLALHPAFAPASEQDAAEVGEAAQPAQDAAAQEAHAHETLSTPAEEAGQV